MHDIATHQRQFPFETKRAQNLSADNALFETRRILLNRIDNEYEFAEGGTTVDRRFSVEEVRCLGACGLAPVVVVDQDTYGDVKADKVIETLEKYE